MSTKNLRKMLDHYRRLTGIGGAEREVQVDVTVEELEAIERAAPVVYELYAGNCPMDKESIRRRRSAFKVMYSIAEDAP